MTNSFDNQELELGQPFVYSDGDRASATFYPSGLTASATLNFSIKEGEVLPTTIEYTTETLNDGQKITVEVAANGYIIKSSGKTMVTESVYDMKTKIEEMTMLKEDFKFAYDFGEHNFVNLSDTIQLIEQDLAEKSAAA